MQCVTAVTDNRHYCRKRPTGAMSDMHSSLTVPLPRGSSSGSQKALHCTPLQHDLARCRG